MIKEHFIRAYNNFMQHLHETMGDTQYSGSDAIEIAKTKTSATDNLTEEEVAKVSGYVTRDIYWFYHYISTLDSKRDTDEVAGKVDDYAKWIKLGIDVVEDFAFDAFMDLADKTRLELAIIEEQAKNYHPYHSGEITGPGTFICEECGKEISFKSTSQIPECPSCQAKNFIRR
jgi:rubrerythrin